MIHPVERTNQKDPEEKAAPALGYADADLAEFEEEYKRDQEDNERREIEQETLAAEQRQKELEDKQRKEEEYQQFEQEQHREQRELERNLATGKYVLFLLIPLFFCTTMA